MTPEEEALAKVAAFVEAGNNPPHWEESGADEWDEWRRLRSEAEDGLALLEQALIRPIRPGEISITPVYGDAWAVAAFLTKFLAEEAKLGHVEIAGIVAAYREWRAKETDVTAVPGGPGRDKEAGGWRRAR